MCRQREEKGLQLRPQFIDTSDEQRNAEWPRLGWFFVAFESDSFLSRFTGP
jgi:hypothetical protein